MIVKILRLANKGLFKLNEAKIYVNLQGNILEKNIL